AELERLHTRHEDMVGRHRSTLHRLAVVDTELRRLGRAAAALARPLLVVEVAHRARAEPGAAQPARDQAGMVLPEEALHGRVTGADRVAQALRSEAAV